MLSMRQLNRASDKSVAPIRKPSCWATESSFTWGRVYVLFWLDRRRGLVPGPAGARGGHQRGAGRRPQRRRPDGGADRPFDRSRRGRLRRARRDSAGAGRTALPRRNGPFSPHDRRGPRLRDDLRRRAHAEPRGARHSGTPSDRFLGLLQHRPTIANELDRRFFSDFEKKRSSGGGRAQRGRSTDGAVGPAARLRRRRRQPGRRTLGGARARPAPQTGRRRAVSRSDARRSAADPDRGTRSIFSDVWPIPLLCSTSAGLIISLICSSETIFSSKWRKHTPEQGNPDRSRKKKPNVWEKTKISSNTWLDVPRNGLSGGGEADGPNGRGAADSARRRQR